MLNVAPSQFTQLRIAITFAAVAISVLTVLAFPTARHWAVIPITLSAIACCLVPLRSAPFHPSVLLFPILLHFFYLAPLLELVTGRGVAYVDQPANFYDWIGFLSALNIAGVVIACGTWRWAERSSKSRTEWILDEQKFKRLLVVAMIISFAFQVVHLSRFGGVGGVVSAFDDGVRSFSGLGLFFTVSEAFPVLGAMLFSVLAIRRPKWRRMNAVLLFLLIFLMTNLLFGGLRGSRANTIWSLFWVVGMVHLYVRRLPRILFVWGVIFVVSFTYIYGFYKASGSEGIAVAMAGDHHQLAEETGRDWKYVLLGDLARTGVQAFVLYRLVTDPWEHDYPFGASYIGAMALIVPRAVWEDRPARKIKYGTQVLHGKAAYERGFRSSRQYGLAGEAIINFTLLAFPIAYAVWGAVLGWLVGKISTFQRADARWLVVPVVSILAILSLVADSDNVVFYLLKNCTLPILVLVMSSRRRRVVPGYRG